MRSFLIDQLIEDGQPNPSVIPVTHLTKSGGLDESAISTSVINTELTTSSTGALILVIETLPIKINGTKITHLYEYADFCSDVQSGDDVSISYSRENLKCYRPGSTTYFKTPYSAACVSDTDNKLHIPEHCPLCSSPLVKVDDLTRCLSMQCPGTLPARIRHWPAWKLFNIQKPDFELVEKIIQTFSLKSPLSLYSLSLHQLVRQCNINSDRARLMLLALEYSKQQPWPFIALGFGIRHLKQSDINRIRTAYPSLTALKNSSAESIRAAGLGHSVTAEYFSKWLNTPKNQELLSEIGSEFNTTLFASVENFYHEDDIGQHQSEIDSNYVVRLRDWLEIRIKNIEDDISEVNTSFQKMSFDLAENQQFSSERTSEPQRDQEIQELKEVREDLADLKSDFHEIASGIKLKQYKLQLSIEEFFKYDWIQALNETIQENINSALRKIEDKYSVAEASPNEDVLEKIKVSLEKAIEHSVTSQVKSGLLPVVQGLENWKAKEVEDLHKKLSSKTKQLEFLQKSDSKQKAGIAALEFKKKQLHEQVCDLELTQKFLNQELEKYKKSIEESKCEIEALQASVKESSRQHQIELQESQAIRQTLNADLDSCKRLILEKDQQLQLLKEPLSKTIEALMVSFDIIDASNESVEITPEKTDLSALKKFLAEIQSLLHGILPFSLTIIERVRHAEAQLDLQNQYIQELTSSRNTLQLERNSAMERIAATSERLESEVAHRSVLENQIKHLERSNAKLTHKYEKGVENKGRLQSQILQLKSQVQTLTDSDSKCQKQLEEYNKGWRGIINSGIERDKKVRNYLMRRS